MLLAHDIKVGLDYPQAIADWKVHALAEYPKEACGFILADGTFSPAENVHKDPYRHFRVSEINFTSQDVLGFLHSHTPAMEDIDLARTVRVREHPTGADMQAQIAMDLPWGLSVVSSDSCSEPIWWGDSLPIRPLLGRQFIWGINDCFSLIRDWHRIQGITIPNYAREWGFWVATEDKPAQDLYGDLFSEAGFSRVDRSDGQLIPGDCFLAKYHSTVRNHAGVYLGNGLMMHHTLDNLSQRVPATMWGAKLDFIVRHNDLPEDAELIDVA